MSNDKARPKSISVYPIDEQIIRETRRKRLMSTDSEVVQWALRRLVRDGIVQLSEGDDGEREPVHS